MYFTSRLYRIPEDTDLLDISLPYLQFTLDKINDEQVDQDARLDYLEDRKVFGETPVGLINGSNVIFTIVYDFVPGSLELFLNGLKLRIGTGNDYQETAANVVTMEYAPTTGDILEVNYYKQS